jgi:hypothetical protein
VLPRQTSPLSAVQQETIVRVSLWHRTGEEAASYTCQPPRAGPHRGSSSLNGVLMTLVLRWMPCKAAGGCHQPGLDMHCSPAEYAGKHTRRTSYAVTVQRSA